MIFQETNLKGAYLIKQEAKEDQRGFFSRYFCAKEFSQKNLNANWVQINNSLSNDVGTIRGMHMQKKPFQEVKLVRCISGAIYDVIVDLRNNSSTFGKYFASELNSENRNMMYVPKGFAHGFITIKPKSEIIYLVSEFYSPESEMTLKYDDSEVDIKWPIKPQLISEKDKKGLSLNNFKNMEIH